MEREMQIMNSPIKHNDQMTEPYNEKIKRTPNFENLKANSYLSTTANQQQN